MPTSCIHCLSDFSSFQSEKQEFVKGTAGVEHGSHEAINAGTFLIMNDQVRYPNDIVSLDGDKVENGTLQISSGCWKKCLATKSPK